MSATLVKKTPLIIKKTNEKNAFQQSFEKYLDKIVSENNATIDPNIKNRLEAAILEFVSQQAKSLNIDKSWSNTKFKDMYASKWRSILINLNPKSYLSHDNQGFLLENLLNGNLEPEILVNMSPQELAPERWQFYINERLHEAKIHSQNLSIGTTDLFKCGKCKQKKCTYYQLQTRSQDEPVTTFITCTSCGNKWRE